MFDLMTSYTLHTLSSATNLRDYAAKPRAGRHWAKSLLKEHTAIFTKLANLFFLTAEFSKQMFSTDENKCSKK